MYGGRIRISGIPNNSNSFEVYASATTGQSHGMMLQAGTNNADLNANFRNTSGGNLLRIRGDGVVLIGNNVVQQGSTSKLEVMGTLNNSYPGYSYPIMVSDDAAYNSSAGPGGGIGFSFKQNSGGAYAQAGGIRGIKENTTDGNYASALTFYTRENGAGTTERLRITSGGQLLLGTSITTQAHGNFDDLILKASNAGNAGMTIVTSTTTQGTIAFSDGTSGTDQYRGFVQYSHNGDMLGLGAGGNDRLQIENDGTVILKNNNGMMMDLQSSAGTGQNWIEFSDTDGTRKGYFGYGSSSSEKVYWVQSKAATMSMYSNGNDRFEVQSNGNKVVKNGRLNISSTFIDFSGSISTPATAAAIYRPADNHLAFSTANVERVKINNDGLFVGSSSVNGRIQVLRNVASTSYSGEFRNVHSVYGGGVQFKSNNTYGTLEIVNYNASGSAAMYNSTGGWHWTSNMQFHSDIRPWNDNANDCGSSSKRWDDIYATNSSIQTSDRNEKNTIVTSDLGLSFINKLKPVSYKFNDKTRTHYGLIAQDVETVLSDISKPSSGFAGFIKTELAEEKYDDARSVPEGKNLGDIMTPAHTAYGLRYNEFIAPLIKAIQELSAKVDSLETEVAALKGS